MKLPNRKNRAIIRIFAVLVMGSNGLLGTQNLATAQLGAACEVVVMRSVKTNGMIPEDKYKENKHKDSKNKEDTKIDDEPVSHQSLLSHDHLAPDLKIPTFLPAGKYVFSRLSATVGSAPTFKLDGDPVRAVLCESDDLVPSEFDIKLVTPKVPLYLSQDFDDIKSDLMKIEFQMNAGNGEYIYDYTGHALSAEQLQSLRLRLKKLNNAVMVTP